jgi:hypothetical protein
MSLERRLANLERLHGDHGPPYVMVVKTSDVHEAEVKAAKEEALRKRPAAPFHIIAVPRPERGQDAS